MRRAPALNIPLSRVPEGQGAPRSVLPALVTVAEPDYSFSGGGGQGNWRSSGRLHLPAPSSSTGTRTTSCTAGGGLGCSGGLRPRCARTCWTATRSWRYATILSFPPHLRHVSGSAWTERHQPTLPALLAPQPRKASAQQPATEVGLQLLAGVLGDAHRDRPIADRPAQRLEVVAHDLVQRRSSGIPRLVDPGSDLHTSRPAGGRGSGESRRGPCPSRPAWGGRGGVSTTGGSGQVHMRGRRIVSVYHPQ